MYDLYRYEKHYYVVMEYCRGGSVTEYKSKIKNSPEIVTAHIIRQVLAALNYLHSLSIVHRDIKIDNIVFLDKVTDLNIESNIPIKIIDFGTAQKMKYPV